MNFTPKSIQKNSLEFIIILFKYTLSASWCPSKNSLIYFLYFIIASRKRFHNQNQFIFYLNWFDEIVVGIMLQQQ